MRISIEDLRYLLKRLNELTKDDIFQYCFYRAYGSIGLDKIVNDGGGCRTIFSLTTKKELYNQMRAFIEGIETEREKKEQWKEEN